MRGQGGLSRLALVVLLVILSLLIGGVGTGVMLRQPNPAGKSIFMKKLVLN